jgi:hypothetical protein
LDLIDNVERLLRNEPMNDMMPWVRGFKGKIYQADHETYVTEGVIRKVDQFLQGVSRFKVARQRAVGRHGARASSARQAYGTKRRLCVGGSTGVDEGV